MEEKSEVTRFFNDFPTNVERCFEPEDLELIRYDKRGASCGSKLLLTIDTHSDGVKK